jgi:hypothetical protein
VSTFNVSCVNETDFAFDLTPTIGCDDKAFYHLQASKTECRKMGPTKSYMQMTDLSHCPTMSHPETRSGHIESEEPVIEEATEIDTTTASPVEDSSTTEVAMTTTGPETSSGNIESEEPVIEEGAEISTTTLAGEEAASTTVAPNVENSDGTATGEPAAENATSESTTSLAPENSEEPTEAVDTDAPSTEDLEDTTAGPSDDTTSVPADVDSASSRSIRLGLVLGLGAVCQRF